MNSRFRKNRKNRKNRASYASLRRAFLEFRKYAFIIGVFHSLKCLRQIPPKTTRSLKIPICYHRETGLFRKNPFLLSWSLGKMNFPLSEGLTMTGSLSGRGLSDPDEGKHIEIRTINRIPDSRTDPDMSALNRNKPERSGTKPELNRKNRIEIG